MFGRRTLLLLTLAPLAALAQDAVSGRDVYGPCAGCHGGNGEGGKGGAYPRLAGMSASYLVDQLKLFQDRKRNNLPMFPYTERRELSEGDMKDVAAYLTKIVLPTRMPEFKPTDGALERLNAAGRVLVVPRVAGDVENGKAVYRELCASCHGRNGRGNKTFPMLVGQYPNYLQRMVASFTRKERSHDEDEPGEGSLKELDPKDMKDILAWLTSIQDQDEAEPAAK